MIKEPAKYRIIKLIHNVKCIRIFNFQSTIEKNKIHCKYNINIFKVLKSILKLKKKQVDTYINGCR